MNRSVFAACALAIVCSAGLPTAARAAEVAPGTTLPDASSLVGFAAAEAAARADTALTPTRISLETESGRWQYRVEGAGLRAQRVRVDINASTGAVVRARSDRGGGGSLAREAAAIRNALATADTSFQQAADNATAANPGSFAHDVRLTLSGNTLLYRVELVNATAALEVLINPVGGAIVSTQAQDNGGTTGGSDDGVTHDQNDDHGGAAGNSGSNGSNSGSSQSGGNGSGNANAGSSNSGSSSSGSSNSGNSGPGTAQPGSLPNQPRAVAEALTSVLAPGSRLVESRVTKARNSQIFEVVTLAPSGAGTKTRIDLRTGAVTGSSDEQVGTTDLARLAAFDAALAGQAALTPQAAVAAAWSANKGDVLRIEPQAIQGRPVYEVRMLLGNRERSLKVNALTGAVTN
ncbi:MAG: PepSY domain-containing protein [Phycisphaerales bacterium]